ncbi:hypothetical protein VKT23_014559 [Stygiomarasmius scandens]|uniref:Uncharacterized protein n=1 Tax=Marasmiellus scandens TaxID=2682957 RepID=A0ABR1J059_9AGAR
MENNAMRQCDPVWVPCYHIISLPFHFRIPNSDNSSSRIPSHIFIQPSPVVASCVLALAMIGLLLWTYHDMLGWVVAHLGLFSCGVSWVEQGRTSFRDERTNELEKRDERKNGSRRIGGWSSWSSM